MPRPQTRFAVFIGILAAQVALILLFSLQEEPLLVLALTVSNLSSTAMLWQDARTPRRACVDARG